MALKIDKTESFVKHGCQTGPSDTLVPEWFTIGMNITAEDIAKNLKN